MEAGGEAGDRVVIRRVREPDVADVVALIRDVLAEFGIAFGEGSATDGPLLELPASYDDHGGAFWVASLDGALVGTAGVIPFHDDHTLELRKMYLRPAARGHRIGQRLLAAAIDFARARGVRRVALDTTEEMTRAIAFYERNGFVRDDRFKVGSRCTRGYVLEL